MRLDKESLRLWKQALDKKRVSAYKEGQKALQKTANEIEKLVVKKISKENTNTGHYIQSIGQGGSDGYYKEKFLHIELGTTVVYAPYIEFGTRPHFPPIKPIEQWVHLNKKKLGITEKDVKGVAFAIAQKISKVGTKENLQWTRTLKEVEPKFNHWFKEAITKGLNS